MADSTLALRNQPTETLLPMPDLFPFDARIQGITLGNCVINWQGVGYVGSVTLTHPKFGIQAQEPMFWSSAIVSLKDDIRLLLGELKEIKTEIQYLRNAKTFVVPLTNLAPGPMQMRLNIPATVEGDGEDFTATFTEANVSASGDTEADAIANLKESIVATYKILEAIPASEMSPLPARQWSVLKSAITR
jgi:predicted RNase H-like HicB family nuclease